MALVDNGPQKGGDADGLADHTRHARAAGPVAIALRRQSRQAHNSPDTFIANMDTICEGEWIVVVAEKNGNFKVFNSRNKYEKTYLKR